MTLADLQAGAAGRRAGRLALPAGLILAELLAISLLYQHDFAFTCRAAAPAAFCAFAGRIVPRALAVLAGLVLFALARPGALRRLAAGPAPDRRGPLALQLAGLLLILAPWAGLSDASGPAAVALAAAAWSLGGILAVAGLAGLLAPAPAWADLARRHGAALVPLILLGMALPELSDRMRPLWSVHAVTEATFAAVLRLLDLLGYAVVAIPDTKVIRAGDFGVAVGPQCSGVEGFALVTAFVALYLALFRRELRFPHVLVLLPLGLALSWGFNAVRITALMVLGAEVSPELAIGGFHSHAGWLFFILLALGIIATARGVPALRRAGGGPTAALPPLFRDPAAAALLPFAVFMGSGLLASTFYLDPALAYPWRALAMAAALAPFWPVLRALPWRLDPLALASGLAIGLLWALSAPAGAGPGPAFAAYSGAALVLWIAARVIGTALLVPLIEELVFRGYLLGRIAPRGAPAWRVVLGLAVSTALFAALHDRWLAAALAGLVFGLLALRRRGLTDAVVSHAAANATIAAWALATGAWHIL